jgi:methanogenic corrinoid protein MtbC1
VIAWCERCTRFLGEAEPVDVYEITHGVCDACAASEGPPPWEASELAQKRAAFQATLREIGSATRLRATPARRLVAESARLGIRPLDLLFGAIQPALYDLGRRWAHGSTSRADEHRFTAACDGVIAAVWDLYGTKQAYRSAARPTVLLANVAGNAHSLAVRLLELLLSAEEVPNHVVPRGLGAAEIVALVARLEPPIVGLSVASALEIATVGDVARSLARLPAERRPRLVVGGFPFKAGLAPPADLGVEVLTDPGALVALARACVDRAAVAAPW